MVVGRRARRVHVEHRRGASLLAAALDAAEAEKAAGGPAYRAALDLALALASDALVVVNSLQHAVPLKLCDAGDVARARRDDGDFVAWLAAAADRLALDPGAAAAALLALARGQLRVRGGCDVYSLRDCE